MYADTAEKHLEVLVSVDTLLEAVDAQAHPYRLSMEAYDIVQRALGLDDG